MPVPGPPELLPGRPDAVVDLRTAEGAALVDAAWRWWPVEVAEIEFVGVGADLGPSGAPDLTYDVVPHLSDLDVLPGRPLEPEELESRLSTGKVCFAWYRTCVRLPAQVGGVDVAGATVVFEIVVDDYAEVWVDGALAPGLGTRGGAVVAGFNAPNRVVLTRDARAGQRIDLAVFGMNGPISAAPSNYIWVRSATLDLYGAGTARVGEPVPVELLGASPQARVIVPDPPRAERVAAGFAATAGPRWIRGALLFSSPTTNTIYRWAPDGAVDVFRTKSGYAGTDIGRYSRPGSHGLTLDPQGRLLICQHGERRVLRVEPRGNVTVVVDRFEGRRLNSPSDVVVRSDGTVFLTDPPFGLPEGAADPKRELPFAGVFAVRDGEVTLVTADLAGPTGLAFSPDERVLYVADSAAGRVVRLDVAGDGPASGAGVLIDLSAEAGPVRGLAVDRAGVVYVCGPGGIWLVAPDGRRLGVLRLPESPHDLAWGDADARTLYVTAETSVFRIPMITEGVRP